MTLSRDERAILSAAQKIRREKNRERRQTIKAQRTPEKRNRGRERDAAHLAFIRRLPCVATYVRTGVLTYGCQAAHVRMVRDGKPGGMQVKPSDRWAVPLTPDEHDEQTNRGGERGYWSELGVDPINLAERLYAVSGDEAAAVKAILAARQVAFGPEQKEDE